MIIHNVEGVYPRFGGTHFHHLQGRKIPYFKMKTTYASETIRFIPRRPHGVASITLYSPLWKPQISHFTFVITSLLILMCRYWLNPCKHSGYNVHQNTCICPHNVVVCKCVPYFPIRSLSFGFSNGSTRCFLWGTK